MAYIIAEIGSNWKISDDLKKNKAAIVQIVNEVAKVGADAVKFQLLSSKELYGLDIPNHPLDKYILPDELLELAYETADAVDIDFMCTAFSKEGYNKVNPYVRMHKIASCENTDHELIKHVLDLDKQVIISTGGMVGKEIDLMMSEFGITDQIIYADCVINYPADPNEYNLVHMGLNHRKGCIKQWALSDHTKGYITALAAQGLGASIFEKHVNFDWVKYGPDVNVSSNFEEFQEYIDALRYQCCIKEGLSNKEQKNAEAHRRRKLEHGFFRPIYYKGRES